MGVIIYIFLLVTVDTTSGRYMVSESGRSHLFVSVPKSVTKCAFAMVF